jgi:hypothetical protein
MLAHPEKAMHSKAFRDAEERMRASGERMFASLEESGKFAATQGPMHSVAYRAVDASTYVSWDITGHLDEEELHSEKAAHADLIRHIFGNPFAVPTRDPIRQIEVVRCAKRLYDGLGSASEVHDALRAAGHEDLAEHFRCSDHPKGCWALDWILDK